MESSQSLKQEDVATDLVGIHPCREQEPSTTGVGRIFNRVIYGSSEHMTEIPDKSVHLIATSPPYNVGKAYEQGQTFEHWLHLMQDVFAEVFRVTNPRHDWHESVTVLTPQRTQVFTVLLEESVRRHIDS